MMKIMMMMMMTISSFHPGIDGSWLASTPASAVALNPNLTGFVKLIVQLNGRPGQKRIEMTDSKDSTGADVASAPRDEQRSAHGTLDHLFHGTMQPEGIPPQEVRSESSGE